MPPSPFAPGRRLRRHRAAAFALCLLAVVSPAAIAHADGGDPPPPSSAGGGTVSLARDWRWPVHPFQMRRAFVAPAHDYGPGHRGIDLLPSGDATVRAPAAGVVAFSGQVAGRGVMTLDHGAGLVSTLEPIDSALAPGTPVETASPLGTVSVGGHAEPGAVHFGVRLDGAYINPLLLLGGVPRAVLLPCC